MTQIQILPQIKAVKPIFTLRIYTLNSMKTEEPQQWVVPLRAETTMGVEGSYHGFITELKSYDSEKPYYVFAGLTVQRDVENYSGF